MQTLYEPFLQALAQRPVAWSVVALLLLIALVLFVLGRRTTRTRNVASHGGAVINANNSAVINIQGHTPHPPPASNTWLHAFNLIVGLCTILGFALAVYLAWAQ